MDSDRHSWIRWSNMLAQRASRLNSRLATLICESLRLASEPGLADRQDRHKHDPAHSAAQNRTFRGPKASCRKLGLLVESVSADPLPELLRAC